MVCTGLLVGQQGEQSSHWAPPAGPPPPTVPDSHQPLMPELKHSSVISILTLHALLFLGRSPSLGVSPSSIYSTGCGWAQKGSGHAELPTHSRHRVSPLPEAASKIQQPLVNTLDLVFCSKAPSIDENQLILLASEEAPSMER